MHGPAALLPLEESALADRAVLDCAAKITVTVDPGDYVIADRSAVIFIAAADIVRVLEAAEEIAAKEAAMAAALREGKPISTVMGGNYESMLSH